MLNEVAYCPRLFALEYMNGDWAESADTVNGTTVHRRVDRPSAVGLPEDDDPDRPRVVRSVYLGDPELGLVGKIDLVEAVGKTVVPIDYKRGGKPKGPNVLWPPERVQICGQALLLRAHGYECTHGIIYFAGAKRRVEVIINQVLIDLTLQYRDEARRLVAQGRLPPPLVDSPKCPRCSLVGICLPDEHNHLLDATGEIRPMVPPRDDGVPLYVQLQGGRIGRDHDELVVFNKEGELVGRSRLEETSRVVILGNVTISTAVLTELASRAIPVSWHSYGGWMYGLFGPAGGHNVLGRIAQHKAAADASRSLDLARSMVRSKIANQRVFLMRNGSGVPKDALLRLREIQKAVPRAQDLQQLMGLEGGAARIYFQHFDRMLKAQMPGFDFDGRNRRPPRDPVNALLSFAYACLAREVTNVLFAVGLDPYVGFLHQPRPGRAALALDLMEEFRPVIADSAVINVINNGILVPWDFDIRTTGVSLRTEPKKRFIVAYERRLDELATHPVLGTRLSYRRILEVQARLLGKTLLGELERYPEYRIR